MPRCARLKGCDDTYHIMVRSISDVALFRGYTDKDKYLALIKKYQDTFMFKVYAYCIMDTHAHFIIYANGADISKIMHGINQCYAQYFNIKYGRHGHVFSDRFKSFIVDNDNYLMALSGYIHNNPNTIKKFKNNIVKYPYSSLGIYMGSLKDMFGLVDAGIVLDQFGRDIIIARKRYIEFIKKCTDMDTLKSVEFDDEKTQYISLKSILYRDVKVCDIVRFVSQRMGMDEASVSVKYSTRTVKIRAICVLLMRSMCDMKYKDICRTLGNITQARASKLCSQGYDLICSDVKYRDMVQEFIDTYGKSGI
jgi:REP element-mobilizing transposase RayT